MNCPPLPPEPLELTTAKNDVVALAGETVERNNNEVLLLQMINCFLASLIGKITTEEADETMFVTILFAGGGNAGGQESALKSNNVIHKAKKSSNLVA